MFSIFYGERCVLGDFELGDLVHDLNLPVMYVCGHLVGDFNN